MMGISMTMAGISKIILPPGRLGRVGRATISGKHATNAWHRAAEFTGENIDLINSASERWQPFNETREFNSIHKSCGTVADLSDEDLNQPAVAFFRNLQARQGGP
jgi:hypothetical protein